MPDRHLPGQRRRIIAFRSLLEHSELLVVAIDALGEIDYVNPFLLQVTGHQSQEILGKNWFKTFLPKEHARAGRKAFKIRLDTRSYERYQETILTRSGDERIVAWNTMPRKRESGAIVGILSIGDDITEREHTQSALRKGEQLHRTLADVTMLANSTLDLGEMLPQICQSAAQSFGLAGVSIFLADETDPEMATRAATSEAGGATAVRIPLSGRPSAAALAMGERRAVHERKAAGTVLAAPILSDDEVIGALVLVTGERGQLGEADLSIAVRLAQVVSSALRNARLYRSEREAAEKLRHMERWRTAFLRIMAHELRTPLGQITGFVDLLDSEADRLSDRGRRYLTNVQSAAAQLGKLSQRSFDLMRLYAADVQLDLVRGDLRYVVETAVASHGGQIAAKGVQLRYGGPSEQTEVVADLQSLHQAVDIILDNAVKYTPAEGVIDISVRRSGAQVEVVVQDSGPGIPSDMREYVFGGQADDVLTRNYSGTGLGLLMARRIAELHGGHLALDPSTVGACFVLSLPGA